MRVFFFTFFVDLKRKLLGPFKKIKQILFLEKKYWFKRALIEKCKHISLVIVLFIFFNENFLKSINLFTYQSHNKLLVGKNKSLF